MDRSKGFSDDVVIFEASVTVLGQEDRKASRRLRLNSPRPMHQDFKLQSMTSESRSTSGSDDLSSDLRVPKWREWREVDFWSRGNDLGV